MKLKKLYMMLCLIGLATLVYASTVTVTINPVGPYTSTDKVVEIPTAQQTLSPPSNVASPVYHWWRKSVSNWKSDSAYGETGYISGVSGTALTLVRPSNVNNKPAGLDWQMVIVWGNTFTNTPTFTPTPTKTHTPTNTPTFTPTSTPTNTPFVFTGPVTLPASLRYAVIDAATPVVVTLPDGTGSLVETEIKNIGAGNVTIDGNGDDTIDGYSTQTIVQWGSLNIKDYSDSAWLIQ